MSLLKKQSSFEEKLKKQLDGTEMKPSDALWNRIEQNMYADSFEPALQEKLENYTVDPRKEVWDQVESQLPESRRKRGFIWFASVATLLLATFGAGYWFNQKFNPTEQEISQQLANTQETLSNNKQIDNAIGANQNTNEQLPTEQNKDAQAIHSSPNTNLVEEDASESNLINHAKDIPQNVASVQTEKSAVVSNKKSTKKTEVTKPKALENKKNLVAKPNSKAKDFNTTVPKENNSQVGNKKVRSEPNTLAEGDSKKGATTNTSAALPPYVKQENSGADTKIAKQNVAEPINTEKQNVRSEPKVIVESLSIKPTTQDSFEPNKPFHGSSYMAPEETYTQFSITAFAGIHLGMMQLTMPTSTNYTNLQKSYDLRKEMETPALDFSGGLLLNYHLGKSWIVSSGIGITSFQQKVNFGIMPALQSNPALVQPPNMYVNLNDSIVVGSAISFENKYSFTEIPLYVTYQFPSERRVHFELMGGVSFGKLNLVNVYMPDPACVGVLVANDKASFPEFKNVFFATLAPNVSFKLNSSVDLGLMPNIKASLNTMVKNDQWIQQRPWLVGLGVYLRKRF
jgi:hypothetical protein